MAKRSGGSNGGGTSTTLTWTDSLNSTYYIAGAGSYTLNSRGKKSSFSNATANGDSIVLGSGSDTVYGLAGNDSVHGGGGNDHLYGEAGNDSLDGGAGNDLMVGGAGNDTISGGDDENTVDTVSYQYASKGVAVDLSAPLSGSFNAIVDDSDSDVLSDIQNINGSDYSDTLMGDTNANGINGGGGADTINGAAGNDTLSGANGQDVIHGGDGNDSISGDNGGTGDSDGDLLFGDAGIDTISGNNGSDYLDGGEDADYLFGDNGSDTIVYDANDESVDGGDGSDTLDASDASSGVIIDLSSVEDKFFNFEIVIGSGSEDGLTGDDGINAIEGGDGNDGINGSGGDDTLTGGAGEDSIDGGDGTDTVDYSGADIFPSITFLDPDDTGITLTLNGGIVAVVKPGDTDVGADEVVNVENIIGTSAKDTLTGDGLANLISAGEGDDTISGGGGADTLDGGDGNDELIVDDSDALVDGGADSDVLKYAADVTFLTDELANIETATPTADGADLTVASADVKGTNNIASFNGFTGGDVEQLIVVGTDSADALDYSTGLTITDGQLVVNAGADNDSVTGTPGADVLNGDAGHDLLTGGAGADSLSGGDGNDVMVVAGTSDIASGESYDGGADSDTLSVTADTDFTGVSTLTSVETITTTAGVALTFDAAALTGDTIAVNGTGDNGGETLTVNGTGDADEIDLGDVTLDTNDIAGATINAGGDDDTVTGTNGADTVSGGAGADEIDGGAGTDLISLVNIASTTDADTVYGFTSNTDEIALTNTASATSGTDVSALVTIAGIGSLAIDDIIADTSANLEISGGASVAIGDKSGVFTAGGYAYETDTGNLYFDSDGDFTSGIVLVGTLYSTASGGADTAVVVNAGDFQFGI